MRRLVAGLAAVLLAAPIALTVAQTATALVAPSCATLALKKLDRLLGIAAAHAVPSTQPPPSTR
jgi:hypothetical protein